MTDFNAAIENLVTAIADDMRDWTARSEYGDLERAQKFASELTLNVGRKYVKITSDEVITEEKYLNQKGTGESDDGYADAGLFDKSAADNLAKKHKGKAVKDAGGKFLVQLGDQSTRSSVWGFVVREDDNKFKKGDILMAASYSQPARNKPRGNIFEGYPNISWTGPGYL